MKFNKEQHNNIHFINKINKDPYCIEISGNEYNSSLLIAPDKITPFSWDSNNPDPIDQLQNLIHLHSSEILLVGSGTTYQDAPKKLQELCEINKIGLEIMSTHYACHTHNILLHENRKLLTILIF